MQSLTRAALSLIVAGTSTAFAFGQTPTPGGAPGNTPRTTSGAPASGAQPGAQPGAPGGATPAQTPRPGGVSPTAPGTIAPAPGTIAPAPGTIQPGVQPVPGQPGAPQPNPIPGQPGAPTTTTPLPGQPGAPQAQPIPGQPGGQIAPQPNAPRPGAQPGQPTQNQIVPGTTINQGTGGTQPAQGTPGVPQPAQPTPGTGTTGTAQPATPGTGTTGTGAAAQPGTTGVNANAQLQANGNVQLSGFGGFGNFGMGATAPFFADQSLRTNLRLSDQQFGTLNDSFSRMMTDFRTGVDRLGNNLSDADRAARTQELWNNANTQFMTGAGKTLNADQQARFRQLALQFQGVDAFRDPTVQNTLNLTNDQQSHLRSIREAFQKQVAGIQQLSQTNAAEANQRWTALQKEMATRVNGVLTADQQKQWAELIGDPFTFSLSGNANVNGGTSQNP